MRRTRLVPELLRGAGICCLLLAVTSPVLTFVFVLSAVLHECAHLAVMRMLRVPLGRFSLCFGGAVLSGSFEQVGYRTEFLCAAAGPFVNFLLIPLGDAVPHAAAVNMLLCIYNLLPLKGNDGAVMLHCVGMLYAKGPNFCRAETVLHGILYGACIMFGAWVFWYGALADVHGSAFGHGMLYFCLLARLFSKRA